VTDRWNHWEDFHIPQPSSQLCNRINYYSLINAILDDSKQVCLEVKEDRTKYVFMSYQQTTGQNEMKVGNNPSLMWRIQMPGNDNSKSKLHS
jgi:hypothetical protein